MSERRVTISLEPIYWHGSPLLTWLWAGVAWSWVVLLALLCVSGATNGR